MSQRALIQGAATHFGFVLETGVPEFDHRKLLKINMPSSKQRVLLAGASGYIGQVVARQLVKAGYVVIALVRDGAKAPPDCQVVKADLSHPETLRRALTDTPFFAVFSCIASRTGLSADAWRIDCDANRHLLAVAKTAHVDHFVLLSAICVQRPKLAFQRAKLAFESELERSGITYSIVRPTAFFKSLSGQIERVRKGKPFLLFGDGTQTACKPISEVDLANYLISCLTDSNKHNRVLPIGGPGNAITSRDQGALIFELTQQTPRFRRVPTAMFTVAIALLAPLSKLIPALAAKAELARIGRYYATESMLVWDERHQRYDADVTPSTGSISLRDHYARVLREGMAGQEAGDQKMF